MIILPYCSKSSLTPGSSLARPKYLSSMRKGKENFIELERQIPYLYPLAPGASRPSLFTKAFETAFFFRSRVNLEFWHGENTKEYPVVWPTEFPNFPFPMRLFLEEPVDLVVEVPNRKFGERDYAV